MPWAIPIITTIASIASQQVASHQQAIHQKPSSPAPAPAAMAGQPGEAGAATPGGTAGTPGKAPAGAATASAVSPGDFKNQQGAYWQNLFAGLGQGLEGGKLPEGLQGNIDKQASLLGE